MKSFVLLCTLIGLSRAVDWDVVTPLDDYVNRPDPTYNWYEIEQIQGDGYIVHVLNFTSQKWMDETYTEEPIWWHYLNIFVPTAPLIYDAAMIHIGNGNHQDENPSLDGGTMKRTGDFARHVGAVSAYLRTVPYQPSHFVGDFIQDSNVTRPRTEDQIIAYTWRRYIEDPDPNPNPDGIVLLPMTKAAKLALDTIHDFMAQEYTGFEITKFMPTGFSKRGWTTWLLGCVDRRVFAMAPTVFDLLNFQQNLEHHYRALGGWSWAFMPYWSEEVSKYLYHPRVEIMAEFIDPLSFNERLTMPKVINVAAGDQFFPPDGSHYFFNNLNGHNFMQIWENDDHPLSDHRDQIDDVVESFFLTVYRKERLPEISWTRSENSTHGIITVQTSPSVVGIRGWTADTTNKTCEVNRNDTCRRDFRLMALNGQTDIEWFPTNVRQTGIDMYELAVPQRADFGYRGLFIEMFFEGPANYEMRFTTEINIVPDVFPYPKCETEDECRGRLV